MRKLFAPPLNALGERLARAGIGADAVTYFGITIGIAAAIAIAASWFMLGLALIILSRIADGLDGAIARATKKTDFGGYLDISVDFLFYGAIPLGFIISNPQMNAIAGAFLLLAFFFNGSTFLGYAILAEKNKLTNAATSEKSLYFADGLLEGTETIAFFIVLCIWPGIFPILAIIFAILCFVTAIMRLVMAKKTFKN